MEKVSLTKECEKICIKDYSPSQTDTFQMQVACKREKVHHIMHILAVLKKCLTDLFYEKSQYT